MDRKLVDLETALKFYHQGHTVVMEFYEPGETKWYAAYAYNKEKYPNELPRDIKFEELSNARFYVLDFTGVQLELEI